MLLGGLSQQYRDLYEVAINTSKKNLFFRPMTPKGDNILLSENLRVISLAKMELDPQRQHLTCFVGGMMGIGSRIFDRPDDLLIAWKLVKGCLWAYWSMPTGIMPETFHVVPCKNANSYSWDETKWYAGIENRNDDFKYGEDVSVTEQIEKFGLSRASLIYRIGDTFFGKWAWLPQLYIRP